ncbi:myristylated membrane protein A [Lymphocystis disease virus 4]|uniref:Myristylated membrane protein A n=1 Tax=Lymphocystis disease virus 4 TaxID=2704413 RepID=A0A6B9XMV2_9VIRU|nr:myristylated membrane protein A [Lymphocystis disease virus 4]QHR78468.1 myristylated membrane protein A [Lymphocystis disease virus 4]
MDFQNIFEYAIINVCTELVKKKEIFNRSINLFYVSKLILKDINVCIINLNIDQYLYFVTEIDEACVTCAAAILYARDFDLKNFSLRATEEAFKSEYLKSVIKELNRRKSVSKILILLGVGLIGLKFPIFYFLAGCFGAYCYYNKCELKYQVYVDEIKTSTIIDKKNNLSLSKAIEKLQKIPDYKAIYHKSNINQTETLFLKIIPEIIHKNKEDSLNRRIYLQDYGLPGLRKGSYYLNRSTNIIYKFKDNEWIKLSYIKNLVEWGENFPFKEPRNPHDIYGRFNGPYTLRIYIFGAKGWIRTKKIVKFDNYPQKYIRFPDTLVIKKYCFKAFYVSWGLIILGILTSLSLFANETVLIRIKK